MQNIDIFYSNVNKLPPQNILVEEILLSNLLVDDINTYKIIASITIEHFIFESHQIIYKNILEIYKKYNYINLVQFVYLLWEKDILKKIGGVVKIKHLIQLSQNYIIYSDKNRLDYVKDCIYLVYNHYLRRLFIQYGYNIVYLSYVPHIPMRFLKQKATKYFWEINRIINSEYQSTLNKLIGQFLKTIEQNQAYEDLYKTRIMSGFQEFDSITSGINKGDLIVIAGRPSTGKTSLAINIVKYLICNLKIGAYVFSLEMSKIQILYKLISNACKIPIKAIVKGCVTESEWNNVQKICQQFSSSLLYIDDEPRISIDYINYQIKSITNKGLKSYLIVVDYLQLIQNNEKKHDTRTEELGYITRQLKIIAKEYNLPIIVLSQLNRNIENRTNKRPLLSDLRESGCINTNNLVNQYILYKIVSIRNKKKLFR